MSKITVHVGFFRPSYKNWLHQDPERLNIAVSQVILECSSKHEGRDGEDHTIWYLKILAGGI